MTTSSSNAAVSVAAQTVSRDINNTSGARAIIAVDKLAAKVRFYDAVSHAEIKAIDTAKFPHELAISPDHRFACVSIYGMGIFGNNPEPGKSIEVYDLESMQRTSTISVEPFFAPHGMMFDASGKLWVGCDAAAKLLCIDAASGKIEAAWDTGSTGSHFISMTPDAAKIYVSNKGDDLGVFDVLQRKFTTTLTLPHGSEGITASPDGRHVVTADNASGDLHVIDAVSDRLVARVPLDGVPPSHPKRSRLMRPRFSPDGRFLIVTNYASATVHVMDTGNLHKQTVMILAKGPMGSAFAQDNRSVLIASHDSGIVTAVDLEQRVISGWFEGGSGIETISYY